MNLKDKDQQYMRRAITLARRAQGKTSPNPMVGCVIVKAGRVIAEGWHKVYGGDHAEVNALKKAGVRAKGATMYVTLEPCAHWGRTPPCVDAVMAAGIKRVVVAMADPNLLTNGKSFAKLRKAGIQTESGVLEAEAREMNKAFIKFITRNTPFVVAKTAQTIDGKIATRAGDSKWITAQGTRNIAKKKRDAFDVILAGVNTVLADDPCLCAPGKRIIKVIVDSKLRTPPKARIFEGSLPGQVIIATTTAASSAKKAALEKAGAEVLVCPARQGKVDLKALVKALARRKITSILIEGGAAVIGSAVKAGIVDEWHVYIAPKLLGDAGARSSVVGLDVAKVSKAVVFQLDHVEPVGPDLFLSYKVLS